MNRDSSLEFVARREVVPEMGDYLLEWVYTSTDWFGGEQGKSLVLLFNSQGILKKVVSHYEWDAGP